MANTKLIDWRPAKWAQNAVYSLVNQAKILTGYAPNDIVPSAEHNELFNQATVAIGELQTAGTLLYNDQLAVPAGHVFSVMVSGVAYQRQAKTAQPAGFNPDPATNPNILPFPNPLSADDISAQAAVDANLFPAVDATTVEGQIEQLAQRTAFLRNVGGKNIPIGVLMFTAAETADPGWLMLGSTNQIVNIVQYPEAFAKFGTRYGGNGTTTFGIPSLKQGYALLGKGAAGIGSETSGEIKSHNHNFALAATETGAADYAAFGTDTARVGFTDYTGGPDNLAAGKYFPIMVKMYDVLSPAHFDLVEGGNYIWPERVVELGEVSGTVNIDFSAGTYFSMTAVGDFTITTSNRPVVGLTYEFGLKITNGGAHTVAWPSDWDVEGVLAVSGVSVVQGYIESADTRAWVMYAASDAGIAALEARLADDADPDNGLGMIGADTSLPYPSGTAGYLISNIEGGEVYLPPSEADQTAAVNAIMLQGKNVVFGEGAYVLDGQVVMQPGCSWIGRGSAQTIVTTSYAGYCVLMRQGSIAIKGMTIKSTATESDEAIASGVDLFTDAVHGWVIEDVIFKSLTHAWKAAGSYMGIFRDVVVEDCGTTTEYAAWLGKNGSGIETNNIQYQNVHFVWDAWLGKGLYTEDYDHSFHGLHIEHCNVADGWTSNARGVTVNGSYLETHGGDSVNQITINNGAVFNGGLVNCLVNTDNSAYKVIFNSTSMIYSKVPSFNCHFNGPDIAGNRIARLIGNTFKYPVTIGTPTSVKLKTKTQGSFEEYDIGTGLKVSGVADVWVADYYGAAHTLSITNTAGEFLTGTRGLKFLKTGSTANGGAFGMCIPATYQTQNRKLSAWAIVKVPQANTTIQCTFGFCGLDLTNGARGITTSYELGDGWVLLIVHEFVPTADYVAFVCNRIGGGDPTNGEYFFVDSFGVCEGGINYESITQI